MLKQFYFKQFSIAQVSRVLSMSQTELNYQVLPLRARVDQGAMAMKGYSAFPNAPALLEPHHEIV